MPHETRRADDYLLSDDPAPFDLARAHEWIGGQSYWAQGIPREVFNRACRNSLTVGIFAPNGVMAGMGRVVTDRATFGWICDVFVDQAHRGRGLGKSLMAYLAAHPDLQGFRRMHLATRDAHGLYAEFGFTALSRPESWMEIRRDDIYQA